jgi:hypothetical protein
MLLQKLYLPYGRHSSVTYGFYQNYYNMKKLKPFAHHGPVKSSWDICIEAATAKEVSFFFAT